MRKPISPYLVLVLAILLPGVGHVAIGETRRGLMFALFTVILMVVTHATTTPDQSFIGRAAGGLFVWALSIPDAYRRARIQSLTAGGPRA
jgi:hypothetical protein